MKLRKKTSLILHNCELGKYTQTIESIYAEQNDHISLEYTLIPIKINLHIELESSINFVNAIFIQIFTFFSKKYRENYEKNLRTPPNIKSLPLLTADQLIYTDIQL